MDEKKRTSTLGKAFSRTFGRKSTVIETPASPSKDAVVPVQVPPVAVAAPAKTDAKDAILSTSSGQHEMLHAPALAPVNMSTLSSPEPDQSISRVASPAPRSDTTSSPTSPRMSGFHGRDGTNMSTNSRFGLEDQAGLNPADVLLNRLASYKGVLKNLQHHFAALVEIEKNVGSSMQKASGILVVPFKDGTQFLSKGGLQDVCTGLRDSTKQVGEKHVEAGRFLETTIVVNIRRLKQDVKAKIKALKSDSGLYNSRVFKEREMTQEKIAHLAKSIGLFEMGTQHIPDNEKASSDPFVVNLALKKQLAKLVNEENLFARALLNAQEQARIFEAHIIKEIKQVLTVFAEYRTQNSAAFVEAWVTSANSINLLQEDTEWTSFLERHGHKLFPASLVDANPDEVEYPSRDNIFVLPVKTATMSRQSSVLKSWKDGYFVLTQAGWLHVFTSANFSTDHIPEQSIFLPSATLGPMPDANQKGHIIALEGRGKGGLMHRDSQTFKLKANSRDELLMWWEELSKRSASSMQNQANEGSFSRSGSLTQHGSLGRIKSNDSTHMQDTQANLPAYVANPQLDQGHAAAENGHNTFSVNPIQPVATTPAAPGIALHPNTDKPVDSDQRSGSTVSINGGETTAAP